MPMLQLSRRAGLLGLAAIGTARADTVLRIGDQRGNQRAVLEALRRIAWRSV